MWRRDLRLFLRCVMSASVFLLVISAAAALAALAFARGGELAKPVRAAVVDNENTLASRMLVHAVGDSELLSGLFEMTSLDADEAASALDSGEISALIILPQGFVGDVLAGNQSRGRVIISDALASQRLVVEKLADAGELLLLAGQNGVFAGGELLAASGADADELRAYYSAANAALLREAMSADGRYFDVEALDYTDTGLSKQAFFSLCWLTVISSLVSVFLIPLYKTDLTAPTVRRIASLGVTGPRFWLPKLVLPTLFRAALIAAALPVLGAPLSLASVASVLTSSAFASLTGAALASLGGGVSPSFAAAVGGLLLCGGIVPRQLLPGIVTAIGDLSPFGVSYSLLAPAFGGSPSLTSLVFAALYALFSLLWLGHTFDRTKKGGQ